MKFYDTSALLLSEDSVFDEPFIISSITLQELENIKSSNAKDSNTKFLARQILRKLNQNSDLYQVILFNWHMIQDFIENEFEITNDLKILSCALWEQKYYNHDVIFVTNDIALKTIAGIYFDDQHLESIKEQIQTDDDYIGYKELEVDNEILAKFYSDLTYNYFNLLENEYLILKQNGKVIDKYKWTKAEGHKKVIFKTFKSRMFGEIKPLDDYQQLAFDALASADLVSICGKPGSGKTLTALSYIFSELEKGKYDKLYIFCNPTPARGAQELGFRPGDTDEKIMSSSVGNILVSKLGDPVAIEKLIADGTLVFLPVVDSRGVDIGNNSIAFITEAQNMSVDLMKLILQRIGEGSKVILDSDREAQLDKKEYMGNLNGIKRVSEIFRGDSCYSEVKLKRIHRGHIVELADRM